MLYATFEQQSALIYLNARFYAWTERVTFHWFYENDAFITAFSCVNAASVDFQVDLPQVEIIEHNLANEIR